MPPSAEAALRRALWGLLIAVMAAVSGAGVWSLLRRPEADAVRLPVYGQVPPFSLTGAGGGPTDESALRGTVWVASFIYTHCTDTCPVQSAEMARLQAEFAEAKDFRLVSITVDPSRDTPEVLARYARQFAADPTRWLFLTGGRDAIVALAREGFRLAVADPREGPPSPLERAFPAERSEGERGGVVGPAVSLDETGRGWREVARSLAGSARRMVGSGIALAYPGDPPGPILHSARLALVDRQMRIRGYYDSGDAEALRRLRRDAAALLREAPPAPRSGAGGAGHPGGPA